MLRLPAPFVPHSASLSPATATRVLSTPVPVSAPPTSLDECLFFISLVSDPLAVRFSVSSGCARGCSVSTYATILVFHSIFFILIFKWLMVVNVEAPEISPSLSLPAVCTLTTFLTSQPSWLCSHDSCLAESSMVHLCTGHSLPWKHHFPVDMGKLCHSFSSTTFKIETIESLISGLFQGFSL